MSLGWSYNWWLVLLLLLLWLFWNRWVSHVSCWYVLRINAIDARFIIAMINRWVDAVSGVLLLGQLLLLQQLLLILLLHLMLHIDLIVLLLLLLLLLQLRNCSNLCTSHEWIVIMITAHNFHHHGIHLLLLLLRIWALRAAGYLWDVSIHDLITCRTFRCVWLL